MKKFTLLEVIIAIAIFAMGLSAVFGVTAMARMRTLKSYELLQEEHMLVQATEYFMLKSDTENLPEEVFPYEGYRAESSWTAVDNLPDETNDEIGYFKLKMMTVELFDKEDKVCRSVSIERIVPSNK